MRGGIAASQPASFAGKSRRQRRKSAQTLAPAGAQTAGDGLEPHLARPHFATLWSTTFMASSRRSAAADVFTVNLNIPNQHYRSKSYQSDLAAILTSPALFNKREGDQIASMMP